MEYVLTEAEFDALDACCAGSKLQDDGFYVSQSLDGTSDFFVENDEELELGPGLLILADSVDLDDLVDTGELSEEQRDIVLDLFEKFDISY